MTSSACGGGAADAEGGLATQQLGDGGALAVGLVSAAVVLTAAGLCWARRRRSQALPLQASPAKCSFDPRPVVKKHVFWFSMSI